VQLQKNPDKADPASDAFSVHRSLLFAASIAVSISASSAASGCRFARLNFSL
jgi:hypothetical protein